MGAAKWKMAKIESINAIIDGIETPNISSQAYFQRIAIFLLFQNENIACLSLLDN